MTISFYFKVPDLSILGQSSHIRSQSKSCDIARIRALAEAQVELLNSHISYTRMSLSSSCLKCPGFGVFMELLTQGRYPPHDHHSASLGKTFTEQNQLKTVRENFQRKTFRDKLSDKHFRKLIKKIFQRKLSEKNSEDSFREKLSEKNIQRKLSEKN